MGRRLLLSVAILSVAAIAYVSWSWLTPLWSPTVIPQPRTVNEEKVVQARPVFQGTALLRQQLLAGLAFAPEASFPAGIPWAPLRDTGRQGAFPLESILHHQPLLFLQMCLDRYDREVHGYNVTFCKVERVKGKLQPEETIHVRFQEHPFSVHFDWEKGASRALRVLFVKGENQDQMRVRPKGFLIDKLLVSKDVAEGLQTSRYSIKEFGLKLATQRSLSYMKKAEQRGTLHLRYEGIVKVPQLNDRPCYKFIRTPYAPVEEDGVYEMTFYIDTEHWLQVGSILKDREGNLIAEYFFRDLELNPDFPASQFTDKTL